jgi:hypothetical protein
VKHVLYARFPREDDATAAVRELESTEATRTHCHVSLHHTPLTTSELAVSETASRKWATDGLFVGGAVGALMGGVVFPAIGIPVPAPGIAALVTGAAGCVYGGVLSLIVGATTADPHLKALVKHVREGDVLVTVEADGEQSEELAQTVLAGHGAEEVARHSLV